MRIKNVKKVVLAATAVVVALGTAGATLAEADPQGYRECIAPFNSSDVWQFAGRACCLAYGGEWVGTTLPPYCHFNATGTSSSGPASETIGSFDQPSASTHVEDTARPVVGSHEVSGAADSSVSGAPESPALPSFDVVDNRPVAARRG